jgi:hypothetical protein
MMTQLIPKYLWPLFKRIFGGSIRKIFQVWILFGIVLYRFIGCLCNVKSSGQSGNSGETVEHIEQSFVCSPMKPTWWASRKLDVPQWTAWKIQGTFLVVHHYHLQILHYVTHNYKVLYHKYCCVMMGCLGADEMHLSKILYVSLTWWHLTLLGSWTRIMVCTLSESSYNIFQYTIYKGGLEREYILCCGLWQSVQTSLLCKGNNQKNWSVNNMLEILL